MATESKEKMVLQMIDECQEDISKCTRMQISNTGPLLAAVLLFFYKAKCIFKARFKHQGSTFSEVLGSCHLQSHFIAIGPQLHEPSNSMNCYFSVNHD